MSSIKIADNWDIIIYIAITGRYSYDVPVFISFSIRH